MGKTKPNPPPERANRRPRGARPRIRLQLVMTVGSPVAAKPGRRIGPRSCDSGACGRFRDDGPRPRPAHVWSHCATVAFARLHARSVTTDHCEPHPHLVMVGCAGVG
eukprot:7260413-Pyramimonas_sp.AAC.1